MERVQSPLSSGCHVSQQGSDDTGGVITEIFVAVVSLVFFHTRVVRWAKVEAAFAMLSLQGEVISGHGEQVCELVDNVNLVVVYHDSRWHVSVLT